MSGTERPLARRAAEWAEERHVMAGGRRVRYRAAGGGAPVVLVHGLGVSADYWGRVGPRVAARGYRVLAPDLPGFGRTPGPRGGLSVAQQAAAVLQFLEALALPPAVLVGHSLSCQAVLELAAAWPERVHSLVLAAPTGAPGPHRLRHQAWGLLRDVPRESLALALHVAVAYLRAGPARIARTWWLAARDDPLRTAPSVPCPALVVVGGDDPVVPLSFARALADALPRGRLAVVPGAAHAVMFTEAEAFNQRVLGFLEEEA